MSHNPFDDAIARVVAAEPVDWKKTRAATPADEHARLDDLQALARLDLLSAARQSALTLPAQTQGDVAHRRWGPLEVLDEIGRGSHGRVFKAWDTRLARHVALKLFRGPASRTIEEGRRLARVSHRNVVAVHGADEFDGQSGIWMELLEGRSLEAILDDQGSFSEHEARVIALELGPALSAVHQAGLIHRDFKTQNVIRESGGRIVLMDMSSSVATGTSVEPGGTPLYMAPELFAGAPATVASDVYAFGVLLYRLVTVAYPVEGQTFEELEAAHTRRASRSLRERRSDLSAGFIAIVERCLAHSASARFESVAALEQALIQNRSRRQKTVAAAVVGGFVAGCLTVAAATVVLQRRPPPTQPLGLQPQSYRLVNAYEDLARSTVERDPSTAAAHLRTALSEIRPSLPGEHPLIALIYAQLAQALRQAGDLSGARTAELDARAQLLGSGGPAHPLEFLLARERMEQARASGDLEQARVQSAHAAETLRLMFALPPGASSPPAINGNPLFTWVQARDMDPKRLGWQMPDHFPATETVASFHGSPAWQVTPVQSMSYYTHTLSPQQTTRALTHGFALIARAMPQTGLATLSVDLSPSGPRFDLLIRRTAEDRIQIQLPTSIVPREGPVFEYAVGPTSWPLLELRYDPGDHAATLLVDGEARVRSYQGHRQFQNPDTGATGFGATTIGNGDERASSLFGLFWLDVK